MTLTIIAITAITSVIGFSNREFTSKLIFDPKRIHENNEWWRFVTCGFLHNDWLHLFINMFVLFSFGQAVEIYYAYAFHSNSIVLYVLLYVTSIFGANVSTYYKYRFSSNYRSLGASGAVAAVVFTTILFNPYSKIYLYGILGLPGIVLGIAYLVYSFYMSKKQGDMINHEAHFYGAIFGMLFTIAFKPALFTAFLRMLVNF